jgi:sensor histidine kinase YesM
MNKLLYNNGLRFRLLRHALFFVSTVIVFALILFVQEKTTGFGQILRITFINGLFFFSYAYITIFVLIPELLLSKKILWFVLLFLLVGIALSALKLVVSDQIFYSSISPENIEKKGFLNLRFIMMNTKDMTFIVALFCIAKYVKDYYHAEQLREMISRETKVAQRKLLQSQTDPHFLFNTINNLYAISLLNPVKTIEVVQRIKIVLNYIIEEMQKEYVSLKGEIELVNNYVQLEKLRYGKRLKVEMKTEGEMHAGKIPPMLLFTLFENSFKHGCSLDAGNPWINASIKSESGKIEMQVENSKPENPVQKQTKEKQLWHLRKRLDLMYTTKGYQMDIRETKNTFRVKIELSN